ncbi:MAG TPA: threonine ammonia-lyase, partial [Haliangiales bacterium]|nr:threonine ammonia-lyase [Haliangiales bacterium]
SISMIDIEAARGRVRDSIYTSPLAYSETFSRLTGNRAFFKLENLQMTGSFKERGALNKVLSLTPEERARGVVAASAGNHAQGVSYHASRLGIRAVIYMPITTPLVKVSATRGYGAEVVLAGADYDEAFAAALARAGADGLTLVHPFDDDAVIAGQGTLGLEMIEQNPYLDAVICPIGGGGLVGGLACAIKETNPKIKVIGVQTARLPSMANAIAEGHPVTLPASRTIADGIAVRRAGERTLPLVARYVDDIVVVDEEEIANAILYLLEREKTVAEGAGAAAVAALAQKKIALAGKRVALVVSGGNIDVNFLARIIERGLVKDGRLVRFRVRIRDYPGALHGLTGLIAGHRANILSIAHDRAHFGVVLGDTAVDVTLETRGPEHIEEIARALAAEGLSFERVI